MNAGDFPTARKVSAFSLVEVVIAIGLVAFVLVSILGLFSVGLRGVGESEIRLEAANLAAALVNQRIDQPTNQIASFPLPPIVVGDLKTSASAATVTTNFVGPGGETVTSAAAARFKVVSSAWRDTTFSTNSDLVRLRVQLTWPPAATNNLNAYKLMGSFRAGS